MKTPGLKDNPIIIDIATIPDRVRDGIARCVLQSVREYFQQPGVREEYERWLAERTRAGGR